jgi:subtilase family serine protease
MDAHFHRTLLKQKDFPMRGTSLPRLLVASALYVAIIATMAAPAASAAIQNRIPTAISDANPMAIPNSVHPKVALATDLGPAAPDTKLVGMSIRFSMTDAQTAALNQLLADLQNPSSPRYHQWLTPAEFGAQFGVSSADIAKVTAWLTSQGFTVTDVAQGATFITFDGTVAQAESAFSTSIHTLSLNGETHFANVTNASVPGELASVVLGITGLHNFRLSPRLHALSPRFTSSLSGNHYVAPGDIYTIYQMKPLLATYTGAGIGAYTGCHIIAPATQCADIAVTGQVDILPADIVAFRAASGLNTAILPTTVHEGGDPGNALGCSPATSNNCGTPNQLDLSESSLDLEWSGAMAPAANILFVNGPDVIFNAMTQAIDQNMAPIVTTSYGACEAAWGTTDLNLFNQLFAQANTQGQTVIASAGDAGATDCDTSTATQGLAVDFPGSSPYVTSMGGTQFYNDASASGSGTTWAATQYWAGTSGTDVISSALSYIPETIWNDYNNYGTGYSSAFGGGGGGASGFFSKPAWQQGTGVPADAARDVPDLALNASDEHDALLFCYNVAANTSCTNGFRIASGQYATDLNTAGGTSFDSQIFGGMLALVEQKVGSRLGNINPTIYELANLSAYYMAGQTIATLPGVVFNDVTAGNNAMPCTAGTANCLTGGSIGYSAGTGYDQASGWGSVNLSNMANALATGKVTPLGSGSNGTAVPTVTLTPSPTSVVAGSTVTLTATVTGSSGTPTGTVQFLVNGVTVGSPVALNASGVATYTYTTSCANLAMLELPQLTKPASGIESARTNSGGRSRSWLGAGSGASIACLLLLSFPRRRRLNGLLLVALCVAIVGGASGCGSSQSGPPSSTSTGPTPGTLVLAASYSGNSTYAGSIASGISAAGFVTSTSVATPIEVTVTVGACTAI